MQRLTGAAHLAFYDSISPIVDASTIDMDKVYFAARWDKGTADYINCPFTKAEYETFLDALTHAEKIEAKDLGEHSLCTLAPGPRIPRSTSKAASPSKRPPAAAATRCASAR